MAINRDKPDLWKNDIARSVDMYNEWFINFAPEAYRATRIKVTKDVEETLKATENLTNIKTAVLKKILQCYRHFACPLVLPLRLIGL